MAGDLPREEEREVAEGRHGRAGYTKRPGGERRWRGEMERGGWAGGTEGEAILTRAYSPSHSPSKSRPLSSNPSSSPFTYSLRRPQRSAGVSVPPSVPPLPLLAPALHPPARSQRQARSARGHQRCTSRDLLFCLASLQRSKRQTEPTRGMSRASRFRTVKKFFSLARLRRLPVPSSRPALCAPFSESRRPARRRIRNSPVLSASPAPRATSVHLVTCHSRSRL